MFKLPAREILWETLTVSDGNTYIVTSNQNREKYHMYEVVDGEQLSPRLGTAATPVLLKNKILKE